MSIPYVNLKFYNFRDDVVRQLPESQARRFRAVVLEDKRDSYLVGMADPTDLFAYDELTRALKRDVDTAVVSEALLLQIAIRFQAVTDWHGRVPSGIAADIAAEKGLTA